LDVNKNYRGKNIPHGQIHGRYLTFGGGSCTTVNLNILNQKGELSLESRVLNPLVKCIRE